MGAVGLMLSDDGFKWMSNELASPNLCSQTVSKMQIFLGLAP